MGQAIKPVDARFPDDAVVSASREDFYAALRKRFEAISGKVEQHNTGREGRILGDLRLIWVPYTATVDGEVKEGGFNVFALLKNDDGWLISGLQIA
ncbi:hypothetical protein SLS62_007001 [Diatrype stigma]|uniref:Uncharacterized protein n=1 Tax=Diatrype stigma TaxID=117547 RepID=A0AAN9UND8_9PEZI